MPSLPPSVTERGSRAHRRLSFLQPLVTCRSSSVAVTGKIRLRPFLFASNPYSPRYLSGQKSTSATAHGWTSPLWDGHDWPCSFHTEALYSPPPLDWFSFLNRLYPAPHSGLSLYRWGLYSVLRSASHRRLLFHRSMSFQAKRAQYCLGLHFSGGGYGWNETLQFRSL